MFDFFALAHADETVPADQLAKPQVIVVNKDWDRNEAIRKRLEAKFKDDRETHPEMWDPNWIKKP
jgi:hypothetical protein